MSVEFMTFRGGPLDGLTEPWPLPEQIVVPEGWDDDPERSGDYTVVRVDGDTAFVDWVTA